MLERTLIMLFWLGISSLIVYLLVGLEAAIGSRKIHFLRNISPVSSFSFQFPSLTLIVAARNEERNLREAAQSLSS